jgi:hypothetical protein
MFLNYLKNFFPGVCRDRSIEVATHFRIVASLGYLPVGSSVKRKQECLVRSHQIAEYHLQPLAEMGSHTPNAQSLHPGGYHL